jgi:hypothetical protein
VRARARVSRARERAHLQIADTSISHFVIHEGDIISARCICHYCHV